MIKVDISNAKMRNNKRNGAVWTTHLGDVAETVPFIVLEGHEEDR